MQLPILRKHDSRDGPRDREYRLQALGSAALGRLPTARQNALGLVSYVEGTHNCPVAELCEAAQPPACVQRWRSALERAGSGGNSRDRQQAQPLTTVTSFSPSWRAADYADKRRPTLGQHKRSLPQGSGALHSDPREEIFISSPRMANLRAKIPKKRRRSVRSRCVRSVTPPTSRRRVPGPSRAHQFRP
jgi:hypothetical protein